MIEHFTSVSYYNLVLEPKQKNLLLALSQAGTGSMIRRGQNPSCKKGQNQRADAADKVQAIRTALIDEPTRCRIRGNAGDTKRYHGENSLGCGAQLFRGDRIQI